MTKEKLKTLIGQRIVVLRTKKGWTQADLARMADKSPQAIEKLENGKVNPSLYSLHEIAEALGVSLSVLVDLQLTDPDFSIDAIPFTAKELRSLVFAYSILQKYTGVELVSQFEAAFHKVVKVVNQLMSLRDKRKRVMAFEKAPYYKGLEHFDVLHEATEQEQPLCIAYRKFGGGKEAVHIFHPYFLKEYKGRLYVIGYSALRKTILTLGLDRIETVREERIPFRANKEINADDYFHHTLGVTLTKGPVETIELWFSAQQGHYIKTQHLHHSQKIIQDDLDGLVISLELIPNYELTSLILSYGLEAKVLKPETLRQKVKEVFEGGGEMYSLG